MKFTAELFDVSETPSPQGWRNRINCTLEIEGKTFTCDAFNKHKKLSPILFNGIAAAGLLRCLEKFFDLKEECLKPVADGVTVEEFK